MSGLIRRIETWCRIQPGDRVVDIGCYDGYLLRRIAARHTIRGAGIDISETAVQLARRAADREGITGLLFAVSQGSNLPFETHSVDVVICSEVLEHVPDLEAVLAEISRVMVRGGRLYATMPNDLEDIWSPLRPLCRQIDVVEGHVRRMSRAEFLA